MSETTTAPSLDPSQGELEELLAYKTVATVGDGLPGPGVVVHKPAIVAEAWDGELSGRARSGPSHDRSRPGSKGHALTAGPCDQGDVLVGRNEPLPGIPSFRSSQHSRRSGSRGPCNWTTVRLP